MNENLTLREVLEQLTNEKLESIMQEHMDWEYDGFVPEDAQLRQLAKTYLGVDNVMQMDRVGAEAFRVYALRAAEMR